MKSALQGAVSIAAVGFALASMLAVGLGHDWRDVVGPLRHRSKVLRALAVNFVLVPILAYMAARVLALEQAHAVGLFLVGAAAGAPFLVKLAEAAGSDVALSATLLVLLLPATIVYMPIVVPVALPEAHVSALSIATPLVSTMLLPLGVGLVVRAHATRLARRVQPFMSKLSTLALVVLVLATILANLPGILTLLRSRALLAALVLIGGALALGYGLGGPSRASKEVLGIATAQRNIAAATVVATQALGSVDALAMIVASSLVGFAILFPLSAAMRRAGVAAPASHGGTPARRGREQTCASRGSGVRVDARNASAARLARRAADRHSQEVALHLYVSPHLDDVALSAGGLVHAHVQAGHQVLVASLCTQDPPAAAARSPLAAQFHEKWGHAELPYEERRHEDRAGCAVLGARSLHLNLPDAIYRGSAELGHYASSEALFHDIPAWDRSFATSAARSLELLIQERRPAAIFGPLAVGRHVDHQHVLRSLWLLRDRLEVPLVLYEDQPYAAGLYPRRNRDAVPEAVDLCPFALESRLEVVDFAVKRAAILCYESQIEGLFGADRAGIDELEAYGRSLSGDGRYRERFWVAAPRDG